MKRKCFLCGADVLSQSKKWSIPNIKESKNIGFGICSQCDLVIQTPTLKPDEMNSFYANTASYINPGRKGLPSKNKIDDVQRLINFTKSVLGKIPKSIFQVGCSDGYTLNQFKLAGAYTVNGIDPSLHSNKVAKQLYGINYAIGTFEEVQLDTSYDLFILTHILEHLYNPVQAMHKCYEQLNENGYVLIEVPLFENIDRFPNGMFSLEHLNYFSENAIFNLLYQTNFKILAIEKLYYNNLYPVITILVKKENEISQWGQQSSLDIFNTYQQRENENWNKIGVMLINKIPKHEPVYIWGGGTHTTQLLANTNISKELNIIGILDSSSTKFGKMLGNYSIQEVTEEILSKNTIIISSYASENEIFTHIKNNFNYKNCIRLYEEK